MREIFILSTPMSINRPPIDQYIFVFLRPRAWTGHVKSSAGSASLPTRQKKASAARPINILHRIFDAYPNIHPATGMHNSQESEMNNSFVNTHFLTTHSIEEEWAPPTFAPNDFLYTHEFKCES